MKKLLVLPVLLLVFALACGGAGGEEKPSQPVETGTDSGQISISEQEKLQQRALEYAQQHTDEPLKLISFPEPIEVFEEDGQLSVYITADTRTTDGILAPHFAKVWFEYDGENWQPSLFIDWQLTEIGEKIAGKPTKPALSGEEVRQLYEAKGVLEAFDGGIEVRIVDQESFVVEEPLEYSFEITLHLFNHTKEDQSLKYRLIWEAFASNQDLAWCEGYYNPYPLDGDTLPVEIEIGAEQGPIEEIVWIDEGYVFSGLCKKIELTKVDYVVEEINGYTREQAEQIVSRYQGQQ